MKKNLLLYILLVFLIVVNAFFLFNYIGKPGKKGSKGPDNFIVKELKFDSGQMDKFNEISEAHYKNMEQISAEMKVLKDSLFSKLVDPNLNKASVDSLIGLIVNKDREIETSIFYKLRSIQELCNDEQKMRFEEIVKNARHNGANEGQGPPPGEGPPRQ